MVNKKSVSKKLIAILLAVVLVIGTLPVGFASVFAAIKNGYTISIKDYDYSGVVTLIDKNNADNKFTQEMTKGKAKFDNLDDETAYSLKITNLYGYEDYSNDNFVPSDNLFELGNADLKAIDTVKVSGKIVDEKGVEVENLEFTYAPAGFTDISFNGKTDNDGKYSFDVYKDVEYSLTFNVDNKKYNEVKKTVNVSNDIDFGDEQLSLKQFSISATVSGNGGNITGNYTMIDYGNDLQKDAIVATADKNYVIDTLKVDSEEIEDAKGQESYDLSNVSALKNVKDTHSVSVSFVLDEIEVTFNISKTGKVKIEDGTSVSTAGTVTVANGSDETPLTESKKLLKGQTIQALVSDDKYHIESFKVGNEELIKSHDNATHESPIYTFDKTKTTITVVFALDRYNITVNAGENGTVTADAKTVEYGSDSKITIRPNQGYEIKEVTVDGNDVTDLVTGYELGKECSYTIKKITKDVYVEVEFDEQIISTVDNKINNEKYIINFYDKEDNLIEPLVYSSKYIIPGGAYAVVSPKGSNIRTSVNFDVKYTGNTSKISKTLTITEIDVNKTNKYKNWERIPNIDITIQIDENAPTISKPAKSPNKDFNNNSYKITTKVEDDHAGVDKVYFNTENNFDTASVANYDDSTKVATFTTTADEYNSKYYIWAVDKVGNKTTEKAVDIKIDNTKPTVDEFKFSSSSLNICDFGTFSNSDITVKITASDKNSVVTNSGVEKITFNGETQNVSSDGSATFTLKASDFASSKEVSATATDFAGNTSQITVPTSDNSNVKSNLVTISTVKADVNISRKETAKYIDDEKYWYAKDTDFTVNVSDDFGIKKVVIQMNGKTVIDETLDETKSVIKSKDYTINTSENAVDGENIITVDVVNVVNNATDTKTLSIYKDTKNPNVVNFEFKSKGTSVISKILNFLTFGNFFNEKVEITVKGTDEEASSGIKNVTLYGNEEVIDTQDYIDGVATFEVPAEAITDETLHLNKTISAKATDNVGNVTAKFVYPSTTNSDTFESSNLMVETIKPTAKITSPTLAQNKNSATDDHNDWCGADTDFNVSINDANSGIRNVSVKVNGTDIFKDSDGVSIDENFYERTEMINDLSFRVNTNLATRADDGSYTIKVDATDNAGNVMTSVTKTIYKDISVPTVKDFKFTSKGYAFDKSVENANTAPVEETSYGYYFIKDTEVTVTADDAKPTSGVKSITYYTVDKDGVKSEEKTELVNKDNQITFTVKANFKGQIYAKACDNVGHTPSTFSKPNGAVIESPDLHTQTSAIKYTLKDSKDSNGADIKDEKGNNLYGADTTVDVEVADTYSGIRRIDWEIVSPFDDKKQAGTVTVDNNGKVTSVAKKGYSDDCLGDWVATGEANTNLVVNLKNTIKVSNDSNDIKIKFTLTDRAGNVTKDVVQTLSIDKTAPKIAVQMNENDDNEFNGYFKGSREADIYVYERNFSQSDLVFDVKRTDDNNKQTNVSPKPKFKYVGTQVIDGRECFVYKMTTKFKADGDYNFKVSASDITSHIANAESVNFKSDNKSVKFSSDKTAEYTSQNDTDRAIDVSFTIDNTNPVVSVSYDNNTAANEKYFNAYRTATLTVVEHNFSTAASRIIYKRTSAKDGANINEPAVSSWSRKGNTYTATIKYNADGDYTFDMQVIDKAGNKDKGVKYNGTAAKDFTVDTTIAKPSIKGVENGKSYKASVLPSISFNDINIANSEIKLLRTRKNEINKDVTSDFIKISKNAKGGSFKANEETFKKLQENDGIYTLSVNISDKAGNKSSETVKFTVNRFGSVYALNKYLVNDLNNSYVQSIDNNLVITEYNPDKLVKGKLDVVVTRDGSPVDFGDGQLTVNPVVNSTVQIGQSGWYQYNYTISKDLFTDDNGKAIDGIYKIYVASEDEVGNKSENINYKDADIMFRLDTTAPSLKSVAGLEKSVVNAAKLDVNYEIFDSIGLKSIDVYYVNENGIDAVDHIRSKDSKEENVAGYIEDVTSYKGKFTIGECTKENVRFVVTDLAGNVTDTGDTNNKAVNFDSSSLDFNSTITVSTNPLTRWYAHTVLFWCSIAVIAVALGAIGFVVATKLRKKEEKATEDYKNSKKNK